MAQTSLQTSIDIMAPAERVWAALTEPEWVKKLFFGSDLITTWEPGTPIRFTGVWEGVAYEDKGTVRYFEPGKKLQYDYRSSFSTYEDKPENYQLITYELQPIPEGVRLIIGQDNIPDATAREHSEQNWGSLLQQIKILVEEASSHLG